LKQTVLVNGQFQGSLPVSDRGLQYGDGVWETLLISLGSIILLDEHLQRLQWGCRVLNIMGLNEQILRQEILLISKNTTQGILKIIITRGSGGRGYSAQGLNSPTRILSLHQLPEHIDFYRHNGITIQYCNTRLAHNPQLAGFKHLNRLEQVLARSELRDDCQEGLVSDIQGNIIEGTMSNLFIITGQQVITPLLTECGIQGIMRAYIISLLVKENIDVIECRISEKDIEDADGIFFSNSVIGLWFVSSINQSNTHQRRFSYKKGNFSGDMITYLQKNIKGLEEKSD
jgi:4-amino-4-deoxychorismate lyase